MVKVYPLSILILFYNKYTYFSIALLKTSDKKVLGRKEIYVDTKKHNVIKYSTSL